MGTPGHPGADVVLAQQKHALDRSTLSDADKQARVDLQKRIHEAVITGKGWESLPPQLRRQVDNPEFQSILTFDPAKVMPQVRQPILVVQGDARYAGRAVERRPPGIARAEPQAAGAGRIGEDSRRQPPLRRRDHRRSGRVRDTRRETDRARPCVGHCIVAGKDLASGPLARVSLTIWSSGHLVIWSLIEQLTDQ